MPKPQPLTVRPQANATDATLRQAIAAHASGDATKAEALYRAVLEKRPGQSSALLGLGVILQTRRDFAGALALYDKALPAGSLDANLHYNRGTVLDELGRHDEAVASLDKAVDLKPDFVSALTNRGNALVNAKRHDEALASFERALQLKPQHVSALAGRGNALLMLGRFDEAIAAFHATLTMAPAHLATLRTLLQLLLKLDRAHEAVLVADHAAAIAPTDVSLALERIDALARTGRYKDARDEARRLTSTMPGNKDLRLRSCIYAFKVQPTIETVAEFDALIDDFPDFEVAHSEKALCLKALDRFEDADRCLAAAAARFPLSSMLLTYRAQIQRRLSNRDLAAELCHEALALDPQNHKAMTGLHHVALMDERFGEAREWIRSALACARDSADVRFNAGGFELLHGRFPEGFADYESRWVALGNVNPENKRPWRRWRGGALPGRTIIVHNEQGLGDAVHFSRYLVMLHRLGADVTFASRPGLHRLLGSLPAPIRLVEKAATDASFDCQCPLLSLPLAFGTTLETIPANIPYLAAEPAVVERWRAHLGEHGFRIGINWQGNPAGAVDVGRSVPLRAFAALAKVPGVRLISLQKNHGLDQLAALDGAFAVETLPDEFDSGPDAFIDTAAVMECLDLVVTSDTSVAHLAGALGRPVWVALKRVPDWRWMLDRTDSPWYPTMTLYRQSQRDLWDDVFERIAADVGVLARQKAAIALSPFRPMEPPSMHKSGVLVIPGSIGELFDKITILEIKEQRIADPVKLGNVVRELRILRETATSFDSDSGTIATLVARLKAVNLALWDIEDDIRDCEHRGDFGPRFIELARAVYKQNDLRAALKKDINLALGSEIVEEKSYKDWQQNS